MANYTSKQALNKPNRVLLYGVVWMSCFMCCLNGVGSVTELFAHGQFAHGQFAHEQFAHGQFTQIGPPKVSLG